MLIKAVDDTPEPYTIRQLLLDNPQVSFPESFPDVVLAAFDVYRVRQTDAPEVDSLTQGCTQDVQLVGSEWTQVWQVVQLPLAQTEANIRAQRNYLLQDSDWVVSRSYENGESVPTDWVVYRQALRDVTAQPGFPYNVIWPTKPE